MTPPRQIAVEATAAIGLILLVMALVAVFFVVADEPLPPCTPTSTSVCTGPPVDHSSNGMTKALLPECVTEDSVACFWDASESGNGIGDDVVNGPIELP